MFRQRLFFGDQIDSCVTDLIKVRLIIIIRLDGLDQNSKTDLAGIIVHEQFDLALKMHAKKTFKQLLTIDNFFMAEFSGTGAEDIKNELIIDQNNMIAEKNCFRKK